MSALPIAYISLARLVSLSAFQPSHQRRVIATPLLFDSAALLHLAAADVKRIFAFPSTPDPRVVRTIIMREGGLSLATVRAMG